VVQSWAPAFDPGLVKTHLKATYPKKACNALYKKGVLAKMI